MILGPRAVIDRSALRHNLGVVRKTAPRSKVMAVVKANAYGHGIVGTAQALIAADAFGVARLKEAMALREAGLGNTVVLLEGALSHQELDAAAALGLETVVHSFEQLQMLEGWKGSKRLQVWCKIDSGMNRLGFRLDEFAQAWQRLERCSSILPRPRLMTHLANADEIGDARNTRQIRAFRELVDDLHLERSIANSAGVMAWPESRVEWVRPGLMIYGISPFDDRVAAELDLRPAMTLISEVIALRTVQAGEEVGYGGIWRAEKTTRVGIVAVGYGDGYPRHTRSGAPVLVNGVEAPMVGRVSMDMIAVDLSQQPNAKVGDPATIWGTGLPAERVAKYADTIPWELVCAISQRVGVEYK